jgi:tetratricopeptide (TPR) repeat protein
MKLSALFHCSVIALLSLGMQGCAPTVNEQVLMPPMLMDQIIGSVEVEPFTSQYGGMLADRVKGRLQAEGHIRVVDKDAEAVLAGTLTLSKIEKTSYHKSYEVTRKNSQGRKYTTTETNYYVNKTASASATYTLVQRGRTLAGNTHTATFKNETSGDSSSEAEAKMANDEVIVANLLGQLVDKIIPDISPHREQWSFELQTGGNNFLDAGADYYKKGLYAQAEQYWTRVIAEGLEPKERAAANYNMGVLKIHQSQYEQAFQMFREADRLVPANGVYMEALAKVEKAGVGTAKLRSMGVGGISSAPTPNRGMSVKKEKYRLTINAVPADSRIRIMNIGPKYHPGIELISGEYKIVVDKQGYHSFTETVSIADSDLTLDAILKMK